MLQSSAATRGKGILKQAESSPEAQRPVSILEGLGRVLRGNAEKNEGDFGAASGIADCLGLELGQRDGKVLLSDIFEGSPAAQVCLHLWTDVPPFMLTVTPFMRTADRSAPLYDEILASVYGRSADMKNGWRGRRGWRS